MATTEKRIIKISFPFGLYFEQLLSADTYVRFINPWSFWRRYKINHLENCHDFNTVQYLKRCYSKEAQRAKRVDYKQAELEGFDRASSSNNTNTTEKSGSN